MLWTGPREEDEGEVMGRHCTVQDKASEDDEGEGRRHCGQSKAKRMRAG